MTPEALENRRQPSTPAVSAVFESGAIVELVLLEGATTTRFAIGRGSSTALAETVTAPDGTVLTPVSAKNNLIRHRAVLLPGPPEPHESLEALLGDIEAHVNRYVDLSPDFLRITCAYVVLSWVYDAFNELPYLRFRGDYGSGKTRALIVIGSLMYKPLFASGASTISPIFHALDLFRGTLVIDESDFRMSDEKAELVKILNQGNVRGFPVLRSQATPQKTFDPRAFYVFGPKLIAMRHSFADQALESRFITEEMGRRRLRAGVPINLPDEQQAEARALRSRLLSYRFHALQRTRIRTDCFDPSLSSRANQVMIPLLSIIGDSALRDAIRTAVRGTEAALSAERAASPEGQLVEILSEMLEESDSDLTVGAIASRFRQRFGDEYDRPISPRYVGYLLRRRLRLRTDRHRGLFTLHRGERGRVASLRKSYGSSDIGTTGSDVGLTTE